MSSVGFVNYTEFLQGIRNVLTEEQYKLYAVGLVELTTFGSTDIVDPIVKAILYDRLVAIEKSNKHYEDCVWYGHLGGRKKCFTEDELYKAVKSGIYTLKGLADYFGCSVRTVNRYITSKELLRLKKIHQG